MTAIIILNWNGSADTIACLESLYKMPGQDYVWVVVDNGSTDDSLARITRYLQEKGRPFARADEGGPVEAAPLPGTGFLLALKENYGFAKGNNMGIAFVENLLSAHPSCAAGISHYLLLNNDTEVDPGFLHELESFSRSHPGYAALTPQIRYGNGSGKVWNCGGKLFFGFRKYLYGEKPVSKVKRKPFFPISLITGCALFAERGLLGDPDAWMEPCASGNGAKKGRGSKKILPETGTRQASRPRLLTERFFFGEEDFDFSLRMRESGKKMACVPSSVVYHKQGATQRQLDKTGRIYVHYLNRFIDVRQHWREFPLRYRFWKGLYAPYIVLVFRKYGNSWKRAWKLVGNLCKEASVREGVDRQKFLACMETGKR